MHIDHYPDDNRREHRERARRAFQALANHLQSDIPAHVVLNALVGVGRRLARRVDRDTVDGRRRATP